MKLMCGLLAATLMLAMVPVIAEVPSKNSAIDDAAYNKKIFELSAILYGVIEIGGKSCKSTGDKMATSLENWWSAVGSYQKGEAGLNTTLIKNQQDLAQKMQNLSNDKNAEKQVESLQAGIESLDAGISVSNGRIALRQNLLAAVNEAIGQIEKENEKNVAAYNNMADKAYNQVMDAAKAACERKKLVEKCTTDDSGNESCVKSEEDDPVPGCDVALAKYSEMQSTTFKKYKDIYFLQAPSTDLNTKMGALEDQMKTTVKAIPPSSDAKFDWTTSMEKAVADVTKSRKNFGITCPNSSGANGVMPEKVSAGAKSFLNSIGTTNLSSEVTSTFTDSWNTADTVVGQPGLRPAYFSYVKERISELVAMDEAYVARATATRSSYANYASEVKKAGGSGGSGGIGSGAIDPAKVDGSRSGIASNTGSISGHGNLNTPFSTLSASSAIAHAPNKGSLSGASLNEALVSEGGMAAIGQSNLASKTKSIAKGSVSSSTHSSADNATSAKDLAKKNAASTLTHAVSNNKIVDQMSKLIADKVDSHFEKLSKTPGVTEIYKLAAFHSANEKKIYIDNSHAASADAKTSEYKNNYKPMTFTKSKVATASKQSKATNANQDVETLVQAIKAKQQNGAKNDYKSSEDDSLFVIITKAYIRSYEKFGFNTDEN